MKTVAILVVAMASAFLLAACDDSAPMASGDGGTPFVPSDAAVYESPWCEPGLGGRLDAVCPEGTWAACATPYCRVLPSGEQCCRTGAGSSASCVGADDDGTPLFDCLTGEALCVPVMTGECL